jgi:hypothetical protein
MADQIQATPRSLISGLFSDVLGRAMNMPSLPRTGIPSLDLLYANRNSLFNAMGVGDVQKTAERISYGEPLTTGSGMTLRPKEETINAAMAVAPLVPTVGRLAGRTGRAVGRMAGEEINAAMTGQPTRSLLGQMTPKPKLLDVYHGTPHTLPPTERNPLGEFDASKIGTGEGAQAYGYGLYTAEVPTIAKEYQRKLGGVDVKLGNTSLDEIIAKGGEDAKAAQRLKSDFTNTSIAQNPDDVSNPSFWKETENFYKTIDSPENSGVKKLLDKFGDISASTKGNLYKVDLPDEKIATMLDWDKPLSQQSPQVQAALKDIEKDVPSIENFDLKKWMDADPLASTWHNVLARDLQVEPSQIAELLQSKGIAGIKYLDEGSRATTGTKTSNFVVFPNEEKSMTILERNGMPASQIEAPAYTDPFGNTIGSSIR